MPHPQSLGIAFTRSGHLHIMPAVDTPFITELRPLEELSVAAPTTPAATAAPMQLNTFTAIITAVTALEELPLADDAENLQKNRRSISKTKGGDSHSISDADAVRVSLVANLGSATPAAGLAAENGVELPQNMRAVTLASFIFEPLPMSGGRRSKRCRDDGDSDSGAEAVEEKSTAPLAIQQQLLRVPLTFRSDAETVRSLAVVAFTVPSEELANTQASNSGDDAPTAPAGKKNTGKLYAGSRRFTVRLHGVQRTALTEEQVLLLSGQK